MVIMKLYTEEQLRQAIAQGYDWCHQKYIPSDNMINVFIKELSPTELPSDEEIATKIENMEGISLEIEVGYRAGARWMRNKILNK